MTGTGAPKRGAPEPSGAEPTDDPLSVLVIGAGHAMMALLKPVFDTGGLKPRHVLLLSVLSGQAMVTQQQLLEIMRVDPSVLVGLLNELEAIGVVTRIRDPKDRRRHLVEISAHGRAVHTDFLARIDNAARPAFSGLSAGDRRVLHRALPIIISASLAVDGDVVECDDDVAMDAAGERTVRASRQRRPRIH